MDLRGGELAAGWTRSRVDLRGGELAAGWTRSRVCTRGHVARRVSLGQQHASQTPSNCVKRPTKFQHSRVHYPTGFGMFSVAQKPGAFAYDVLHVLRAPFAGCVTVSEHFLSTKSKRYTVILDPKTRLLRLRGMNLVLIEK